MASMKEMSLDEEVQSVLFNQHSSKNDQPESSVLSVPKKCGSKKKSVKKQPTLTNKGKEEEALNMSSLGHDQTKSAFIPYQVIKFNILLEITTFDSTALIYIFIYSSYLL